MILRPPPGHDTDAQLLMLLLRPSIFWSSAEIYFWSRFQVLILTMILPRSLAAISPSRHGGLILTMMVPRSAMILLRPLQKTPSADLMLLIDFGRSSLNVEKNSCTKAVSWCDVNVADFGRVSMLNKIAALKPSADLPLLWQTSDISSSRHGGLILTMMVPRPSMMLLSQLHETPSADLTLLWQTSDDRVSKLKKTATSASWHWRC